MAMRLEAVAFDVGDVGPVARFWAGLLGRDIVADPHGALLPGSATQVGLRFVEAAMNEAATARDGLNRLHLHLTSASPEDQDQIVQRALELGGSHLDVGQLPEEGHVVLADPAGNELCVIGPDSTFLDGCGPLGEIACDGTRAVGLFWSTALDWPLVWDQDEETAVQSPAGGTKVAWGGPPVAPKRGRNRQRFELVGTEASDVDRLRELGATTLDVGRDWTELADPDGNEFRITRRVPR